MNCFPVVCRNHLDRVPGTTIEKRTVRTFAGALLTTDAEIGIDFDSAKRRMIFIGYPEHASLNRAILDTCRRPGAASATVGGNSQYARSLLARRFAVALRHWPMFFDDVEHPLTLAF